MKKMLFVLTVLFSSNVFAVPVNINTADAQKIADSLVGLGLKKAQAVVDYRTKNGEFKTLEDLNKVPGIGDKTIEKNKADILFSDEAVSSQPATSSTTTTSPESKKSI